MNQTSRAVSASGSASPYGHDCSRDLTLAPGDRARLDRALALLGALGALLFISGLWLAPERIWPAFLVALLYLVHISLAALFFIAVQYVTKAEWSVKLRFIPESIVPALAWAALLAPMLLFGSHTLYEWTHEDALAHGILAQKKAWLNLPFFSARSAFYFLSWLIPAYFILRNARRAREDGSRRHTNANIRISAGFLVIFAITVTLSSFDWLMSLEPEWYSTIFGAYVFSGMFLTGSAVIAFFAVMIRRREKYVMMRQGSSGETHVTEEHLHDLGKILFAFSSFWAYLWFCQYMLIWYTNMPEESAYFARRMRGGWQIFFWINVALNWIIPFFGLMSRRFKRNDGILILVAVSVILGHWIDLYVMVTPVFFDSPVLGAWEVGPTLGVLAIFLITTLHALRTVPLIPTGDPLLEESVGHC